MAKIKYSRVDKEGPRVIPKHELWMHRSPAAEQLDRAIEWAEKHPPRASRLEAIERKLSKGR